MCLCVLYCVCAWVCFREDSLSLTKQNQSVDEEGAVGSVKDTPGEKMLNRDFVPKLLF